MIKHIDIYGINLNLEEDIQRYITRKIGRLERLIPRQARASVHAEVRIKEVNESHGNKYRCEAVIHLPEEQLTASDSTMNQFAAVDIVEEKLKNLLHKYKELHSSKVRAHGGGIIGRFKRRRAARQMSDPSVIAEVE
jgi:ribosomal subunit interface protein